jgi:tetratricopeptide (TPR) repeat protein
VACLDDNAVLELVTGVLPPGEQARAQEHLDTCGQCRALVAEVARDPEAAPADDWDHVPIGAQLGRYRITAVLGAGAMGCVLAATDPELGRTVALKLLRASGGVAAELRPRLLREAQALARLSHPNVVTVHDVGSFGPQIFVALEWVDGGTLSDWLRERRTRRAIVDAFRQAGEGLAAAHAVGLVHRDFKPDNVLVGKDGRVRVTDFGLALHVGAETAPAALPAQAALRLTSTGLVVGTPAYLAPEQLDGKPADARSDQFAFCVALFEALHGHRPFAGDDWPALRASVLAGELDRRPGGPRVPWWLDRVVARGLERDPARRWPTMRALLDALARGPLVTPSRIALAAVAIGAIVIVVELRATATHRREREAACREAAGAWAPVWTDASAAALPARLGPGGAPVAATVDRAFRAYGDAWAKMTRASCLATEVEGTQARDVYLARERCLAERRDYAHELARALFDGPPPRIDGALEVASSLPSIDGCANTQALLAMAPAAESAEHARLRAELEARMAGATIAGYLRPDADPHAFAVLADEAHALGVPALESRARLLEARNTRDETEEQTALHAAALAALAAHDDGALADAWARMSYHAGFHAARYQESADWTAYAQAALDRLGGDPTREADLLTSRGFVLIFEGRPEEARHTMARARELLVASRGPDDWRIALALYGEGGALLAMGKLDDALALYRQARDLAKRVAGESSRVYEAAADNEANALVLLGRSDEALAIFEALARMEPNVSWRENQVGAALRHVGRFSDALAHDQHATAIVEAQHQTGRRAGDPPLGVGLDLLGLGRAREAVPLLARALELRQGQATPDEIAEAQLALARALRASGGDAARARALATSARDLLAPLAAKYGSYYAASLREVTEFLGPAVP